MRILLLGGTGIISHALAREAVARGFDVTTVTRGASTLRAPVEGLTEAHGDVNDGATVPRLLDENSYDVAIDVLGFTPDQVERDIEWFRGRVSQYVFISSASAYQTPPLRLPITESTPLRNPFWQYSRNKIACEDHLVREYRESGFPVTIVRPSHTYDDATVPLDGGWTAVERMRRGAPVAIPGDDVESLWTLTHAEDVAAALVTLLGRDDVAGEAFHITGDEHLTWTEITQALAEAAGAEATIVPVTSDQLAEVEPERVESWRGDKSVSRVLDNTKIKGIADGWSARVPWAEGARRIVAWHDADPARRTPDPDAERLLDLLTRTSS